MVLPFMICAWGTAYKLSLYKTETNSAPAKVCTRGSDAAKSSVSQAIDWPQSQWEWRCNADARELPYSSAQAP